MRVLVVEHERDSGIGLLGRRAGVLGHELVVVRPGEERLPTTIDGYDGLVVLGASPSVNDSGIAAWFEREVALIRHADATATPVLGVCFGAQALAVALGGSVARAAQPEVGWMTIESVDTGQVPTGPWFQWHVDAITPPPHATVLARSEVCVQAFTVGPHLGVQFHPEVTDQQVRDWIEGDPGGMAASQRTTAELLAQTSELLAAATQRAADLWDRFAAQMLRQAEMRSASATG
jgi:GMP synthase-like glutamine amidotransferase